MSGSPRTWILLCAGISPRIWILPCADERISAHIDPFVRGGADLRAHGSFCARESLRTYGCFLYAAILQIYHQDPRTWALLCVGRCLPLILSLMRICANNALSPLRRSVGSERSSRGHPRSALGRSLLATSTTACFWPSQMTPSSKT